MALARKHDVLRGLRDSGDRREEVARAPGPRVQGIRPSEAIQFLEETTIIVIRLKLFTERVISTGALQISLHPAEN